MSNSDATPRSHDIHEAKVDEIVQSDGDAPEKRNALYALKSVLETGAGMAHGHGVLIRRIEDELAKLDSAGGEAGTRSALKSDEQDRSDAQPLGGRIV